MIYMNKPTMNIPCLFADVTGITLNKTTTSIKIGANETLVATVVPSNAFNKKVVWSSADNAKATVDQMGKVIGVAAGTVKIKCASVENGAILKECTVTVTV